MFIKRLAFFLALIAVNNVLSITPNIPTEIYAFLFFICFVSLFFKGKIQIFLPLIVFVVGCVISVFFNDIPYYFNSELRLISFLLVFTCIGPLFYNQKLGQFRIALFNHLVFLLIAVVVISVLGKFSGIYSGTNASSGLFQGITNHSMTLGPIAALVIIFSVWRILELKRNPKLKKRYVIIVCISFLCILIAASRGAIIGGLLGLLFLMVKKFKGKMTGFVKVVFSMLFLVICTSGLWMDYADNIIKKNVKNDATGGFNTARELLWDYRLAEFDDSPIYGIGFASAKYGLFDTGTGQIEPGTAWGAIFAQTGLIGGLSFLLMILYYLIYLYKHKDKNNSSSLLLGFLIFFVIHWLAEGYMLGSGDFLFFTSWLLLGVIDSYMKNDRYYYSSPLIGNLPLLNDK